MTVARREQQRATAIRMGRALLSATSPNALRNYLNISPVTKHGEGFPLEARPQALPPAASLGCGRAHKADAFERDTLGSPQQCPLPGLEDGHGAERPPPAAALLPR